MSSRHAWLVGLISAALLCGVLFISVSSATIVPLAAKGAGPGGVQVTTSGWLALILSAFGTGGFTIAGVVKFLATGVGINLPDHGVTEQRVEDLVELGAAFTAFMRDRENRAAQRRFVFALVDESKLIPGIETSHENGVIVLKYSGYADPVSPAEKG